MEQITAGEIMSSGLVTCRPEMSLLDVARLLVMTEVTALVVVDGEGRNLGIISQFDLLGMVGEDLSARCAEEIMTQPVLAVDRLLPIQEAANIMKQHRIHRLAVTGHDPSHALGVLSVTDIVRAMSDLDHVTPTALVR
jgi:CBS domain-containing protein